MPVKPQLRSPDIERLVQTCKDAHELMKNLSGLLKDTQPEWSESADSFAKGSEWVMGYNIVQG